MGSNDLLERLVRLDPASWEALLAEFRPTVIRILARLVGSSDPDGIVDLEQEVYLRLLAGGCEPLRRLRETNSVSLRSFVNTTAANVARDHRRRLKVRRLVQPVDLDSLEQELWDPASGPDERALARLGSEEALAALRQAVTEPNAARDSLIFKAYYVDGLTASEIGSLGLGLKVKGVEAVLYRLTAKVRALLLVNEEKIS